MPLRFTSPPLPRLPHRLSTWRSPGTPRVLGKPVTGRCLPAVRVVAALALAMTPFLSAYAASPLAAEVGPLAPEALRCPGLVDPEASRPSPDSTLVGWEYRWETFAENLREPVGVAVDRACNVYVADYDPTGGAVVKLSKTGETLATWGAPGRGVGQLERLEGVAVDAAGNVYAADSGNNRVQRFTPAGVVDTVWASVFGCQGVTVKCNVVPEDAAFNGSLSVGVDGAGNLWVVDGAFGLKKFAPSGAFLGQWGTPLSEAPDGFQAGDGIAFDGAGNVYVADAGNKRVQVYSQTGALLRLISIADDTLVRLENPRGVAVGPDDTLYVSDTDNQRVVVFAPSGEPVSWAGRCVADEDVTPCPRTGIGDEPGAFAFPAHLAANGRGELFVADRFNRRVQVLRAYPVWAPPASEEAP